jgi:integrase
VNLVRKRKPARKRNTARREARRDYLTSLEGGKLIAATWGSRNEARDRCLLLLIFRHGLRVSEACRLKLEQVDTKGKVLHITRLKRGFSTTHSLRGDELKAIGAWLKQRARMQPTGKTFFVSEQWKPLHRSTVNLILQSCSKADLPFSQDHLAGTFDADIIEQLAAHSSELYAHQPLDDHGGLLAAPFCARPLSTRGSKARATQTRALQR